MKKQILILLIVFKTLTVQGQNKIENKFLKCKEIKNNIQMTEQKKYKLIYKDYEIGIVTELSNEWPRPSGTIELYENLKELNEETKSLYAYFEFSINSSELLENSSEEEYNKYCEENEFKYLNLIDSKEWFLIDKTGKRNNIVIPFFYENDEIVWTAFED